MKKFAAGRRDGTARSSDMYTQLTESGHGVVAILRGTAREDALACAAAFAAAGIKGIEITFNTPGAPAILEELVKKHPELCIGAGTVLTLGDLERAADAGAKFILSPDCNPEVIAATKSRGLLSVPGAYTPTEVLAAVRAGADIVKVFPAGAAGASYIKDLLGPFTEFKLMAVGGVNLENTAAFFKAGAVGVGIGSRLVDKDRIRARDWIGLQNIAVRFLAEAKKGRESRCLSS